MIILTAGGVPPVAAYPEVWMNGVGLAHSWLKSKTCESGIVRGALVARISLKFLINENVAYLALEITIPFGT